MIRWLAERRQARLEYATEIRLRRLIRNVSTETVDFYIPSDWVAILGRVRVNAILAEHGVPPARPERRAA